MQPAGQAAGRGAARTSHQRAGSGLCPAVARQHSRRAGRRCNPARARTVPQHRHRGAALCRQRADLQQLPPRRRAQARCLADVGGMGDVSRLSRQGRPDQHDGGPHPRLLRLFDERAGLARRRAAALWRRYLSRFRDLLCLACQRRAGGQGDARARFRCRPRSGAGARSRARPQRLRGEMQRLPPTRRRRPAQ